MFFLVINNWLSQFLPLVVTIGILLMLLVLIVGFSKIVNVLQQRDVYLNNFRTFDFDGSLRRAMDATEHATDVSSVIKLMSQLEHNPNAMELIKSYPETVLAAAWLHRVNSLGDDLRKANKELSYAHENYSITSDKVKKANAKVESIQAKLTAAVTASGEVGLRTDE